MAHKGVDVAEAGRLTAGVLTELLYPLSRAQALAAEARGRVSGSTPPPALAPFEELLDAYAALCDAIDRARRVHRGPVPEPVLAPALARVDRAADAVEAALAPS